MERVSCILFLLLLAAAPPNVAATQDLFYQMLGTRPLAVRLDNQWADDEKSCKSNHLHIHHPVCIHGSYQTPAVPVHSSTRPDPQSSIHTNLFCIETGHP